MIRLILLSSILIGTSVFGQTYKDSILEHRILHIGELIDSTNKILTPEEVEYFDGLAYFEIDTNYRLESVFTKSIGKKFKMPTSTDRAPIYRRYGYVDFSIDGKKQRLSVYQNMEIRKQAEFKKYLFIPFRDATCGNESYGGGRYLDMQIPDGNTFFLDFNLVYNPYCVYSHRYSCPIPPVENTLSIPIRAGEKVPVGYSKD